MNKFVTMAALLAFSVAANSQTTSTSLGSASSQVAPSTNTSSVGLDKAAPARKISFVAAAQVDTSEKVIQDASQAAYSWTNYVGAAYKLNADDKIALKHYFSYAVAPGETSKGESMDTVLQYSTKTRGILGSEDLAPLFWYYAPTSALSNEIHSNGKIRLDVEAIWAITPKWKVSYYLNPRQSFTPDTTLVKGDKPTEYYTQTTLLHQAYVYYFFNDDIQAYANVGTVNRWKTTKGTYMEEELTSAVGGYIQAGSFSFNPEISNSVLTRTGGASTKKTSFWQNEDLTYTLVVGLSI